MIDLSFESSDESLQARRVLVHEGVSRLFEAEVEAVAPSDDLRFDSIVGKGASLRIGGGAGRAPARVYRGICRRIEQIRVEPSGLSTYALTIVPSLWLLGQRTNHRLFQHLSAPEIALALLEEWGADATLHVDRARHPRLETRLQYGESDLGFLHRVLDEAGIAFVFANVDEGPTLVLTDDLHALGAASVETIPFVDDASSARGRAHATLVRISQEVRPTRFAIRDADFRRPEFQLIGAAESADSGSDVRLEQYRYRPGAFLVDSVADPRGAEGKHDEREGHAQAERDLGRERSAKRGVSLRTNVVVAAGELFAIAGHPKAELGADHHLVVAEVTTEATIAGDIHRSVRAGHVGRAEPWLPPVHSSKPRIHGVQTATVVGPRGQEIHTDELGRVRVQFPWDREGRFDERSSCWLRVSQGWAGGAHGMIAIPRVGQEVLVEFVDGDPDHPIVVGRVFNAAQTVPYKLPENATVSSWKSASSPGGEGSNEILFEDAKGGERFFVHAERDLERFVNRDQRSTIGNDRGATVSRDDTVDVGRDRRSTISGSDVTQVGARHAVSVVSTAASTGSTGSEIVDGRIRFTTGEASLTLEGPNVTLEAAKGILLKAASEIALLSESTITARADVTLNLGSGSTLIVKSDAGDVVIQGGPFVRINPDATTRGALAAAGVEAPPNAPPGVDLDLDILTAEDHARFDPDAPAWLDDQRRPGGPWDYAGRGPEYAPFASFHLGVVGAAMGMPEGALLHQAGAARQAQGDAPREWGDPGNGLFGGSYPYGGNPRDQEMTRSGYAFYARRYG